MSIKEIYELSSGDTKRVMLYLRNEDNMKDFIKETSYLPNNIDKSMRYYCWLNNLKEIPVCPYCGKPRKFHDLKHGFFATCNDRECKSKAKSDANRKRIVDWSEVHKKMEETYAANHNGIHHNMQDPEFKQKFFENYKEKHNGESCGVQSKKAKENRDNTFQTKYNGSIRSAFEQGIIEKYGSLSECAKINASKSSNKIRDTKTKQFVSKIESIGDYDILNIDMNTIFLKCRNCGFEFTINRSTFNKMYRENDLVLCINCGFDTLINDYNNGDISTRQLITKIKLCDNYINELKERTSFLDEYNPTITERLYYIVNDIDSVVLCKYCNKKAKWNGRDVLNEGYISTCDSKECESKRIRDAHTGSSIISEDRLKHFIEWQNSVSNTLTDDDIINNIKYDYLYQYVGNLIIIDYINNRFNDSESVEETLKRIELHIEKKPICANPNCNNPVKWIGRNRALWTTYCSCSCSANSEETNRKKRQTSLENWGTECPYDSSIYKQQYFEKTGYYHSTQIPEVKEKIYLTSKKNSTGRTSKLEQRLFNILQLNLGYDIITHYRSDLYPFSCDVYIPKLDLYIEYQGWQGHGEHPYTDSKEDKAIINKWKENESIILSKRRNSKYTNMIYVWTVSDPLKRSIAKENKLNYLEIFKFKDAIDVKKQIDDYLYKHK